jgi:hypothetical protein
MFIFINVKVDDMQEKIDNLKRNNFIILSREFNFKDMEYKVIAYKAEIRKEKIIPIYQKKSTPVLDFFKKIYAYISNFRTRGK